MQHKRGYGLELIQLVRKSRTRACAGMAQRGETRSSIFPGDVNAILPDAVLQPARPAR